MKWTNDTRTSMQYHGQTYDGHATWFSAINCKGKNGRNNKIYEKQVVWIKEDKLVFVKNWQQLWVYLTCFDRSSIIVASVRYNANFNLSHCGLTVYKLWRGHYGPRVWGLGNTRRGKWEHQARDAGTSKYRDAEDVGTLMLINIVQVVVGKIYLEREHLIPNK